MAKKLCGYCNKRKRGVTVFVEGLPGVCSACQLENKTGVYAPVDRSEEQAIEKQIAQALKPPTRQQERRDRTPAWSGPKSQPA